MGRKLEKGGCGLIFWIELIRDPLGRDLYGVPSEEDLPGMLYQNALQRLAYTSLMKFLQWQAGECKIALSGIPGDPVPW